MLLLVIVVIVDQDGVAVLVRGAGTAKFDILDTEVAVADDPDGLALGAFAIGDQHRPLADAADGELLLQPDGNVATVFTGQDFDGVAILGQTGGFGYAGEFLARTDAQDGGVDKGKASCQQECQNPAAEVEWSEDRRTVDFIVAAMKATLFVTLGKILKQGANKAAVEKWETVVKLTIRARSRAGVEK